MANPRSKVILLGLGPSDRDTVQLALNAEPRPELITLEVFGPRPPVGHLGESLLLLNLDLFSRFQSNTWQPDHFNEMIWFLTLLLRKDLLWIGFTSQPDRFPEEYCRLAEAVSVFSLPAPADQLSAVLRQWQTAPQQVVGMRRGSALLYRALALAHLLRAWFALVVLGSEERRGVLVFQNGEVDSAYLENGEDGEPALAEMMSWTCKEVRSRALQEPLPPNNLEIPFREILTRFTQPDTEHRAHRAANEASLATRLSNDPDHALADELEEPEARPSSATPNRQLVAICEQVVHEVQDALACGVVDVNTGMILGIHHSIPWFTPEYIDAVAAATVDQFRGRNVRRIEDLLSKARGRSARDSFEEIFIRTAQTFHFMKLLRDQGMIVLLITRTTINQGMGWAGLRKAVTEIISAT